MKQIAIIALISLSSCFYPKEIWVKRDSWTCIKITEGSKNDSRAWYVKWRNEDGQVVYEIVFEKPKNKVGDKIDALLLR